MPTVLPTIRASASMVAAAASAGVPTVPGYHIVGRLGEGGMGTVWRAVQIATRREVALKVMGAAALGSDRARRRFEREVELSARLDHPFVARVFDGGLTAGLCYYALELVEDGVPLDAFAAGHGLDRRGVIRLVRDVCRGVQHAHQLGIIHRDLKPGNILVTPDGRPKVLDFGLAKAIGAAAGGGDSGANLMAATIDAAAGGPPSSPSSSASSVVSASSPEPPEHLTMVGEVAGTPSYMSPEQAAGRSDRLDTRSDVYTLGVILFRLVSGQFPHDAGGGYLDVIRRVAEQEPRRIKDVAPAAADRDLGAVLDKALEREPGRRYGSAGELADDLDRYLAGEPIVARPQTLGYWVQKRVRRHKLPLAAAAVVAAAVAGSAVWSYVRVSIARDRAESAEVEAVRQKDEAVRQRSAADASARRADDKTAEAVRNGREAASNLVDAKRAAAYGQVREADALGGGQNRWDKARRLYASAAATLAELKLDPLSVRLGEWEADRRAPPPLATLVVDAGAEEAVSFSRDGKLVASGGSSRWVRVWELPNGRRVASAQVPAFVRATAFANDASFVVSGCDDGIVRRDALAAGGKSWQAGGGAPLVAAVAVTPDDRLVLALSADGKLTCRSAADGKEVWSTPGPRVTSGQIVCLPAIGGGGGGKSPGVAAGRAVVARVGGVAAVVDLAGGKELYRLAGGADLAAVCLVPGHKVLGGNRDGLWLWDADTGRALATVVQRQKWSIAPGGLGVSPGGGTATVACGDFALRLVDLATGEVVADRGWTGGVRRASVSPDGRTVLSGDNDGRAMVWGVEPGPELLPVYAHAGAVTGVALSPDGRLILSAGADRTLSLRDAATGGHVWTVANRDVGRVAVLPDNRHALVVDGGELTVWDLLTASPVRSIGKTGETAKPGEARALMAASADGRLALTAGERPPRLWDVAAGRDVTPPGGFAGLGDAGGGGNASGAGGTAAGGKGATVVAVALSADGRRAVTGTKDEVAVWDTVSGRAVWRAEVEFRSTTAVAISADGRRVAGGAYNGSTRVWDAATGELLATARGQFGSVRTLGFAPDGRWLLAGYASGMAIVYDPAALRDRAGGADGGRENGGELRQVEAHRGDVNQTAVSADGRRVATAGADGVVALWNLDQPDETAKLSAAVAAARDTLAVTPENGPALATVAAWYAARGRADWAVEVGLRARRYKADVSPLTMARCYWRLGKPDEAAAEFREALRRGEAAEPYLKLCLRGVGAGE